MSRADAAKHAALRRRYLKLRKLTTALRHEVSATWPLFRDDGTDTRLDDLRTASIRLDTFLRKRKP